VHKLAHTIIKAPVRTPVTHIIVTVTDHLGLNHQGACSAVVLLPSNCRQRNLMCLNIAVSLFCPSCPGPYKPW
jgi:hypothetical protein